MGNVLRIAVVDPKDASRDALKSTLLGLDTVWLEAECSRYEFFADVVGQTKPDVGFVALDSNPDQALELVAELAKSCAGVRDPGHQQLDRRQPDPADDAGRGERVPHAAAQAGRPRRRAAARRAADDTAAGPASRRAAW